MKPASPSERVARSIEVHGVVQGVGFRPFVWRLAAELGLDGSVINRAGQVEIEVAGSADAIEQFARRIRSDAPPRARVEQVAVWPLDREVAPGSGFTIGESEAVASAERLFPPDIATCDDCLRELFDPADRRYRYPFTNCTNCGPRATIIDELPYDRARTSMREFPLCAACAAEYRDPSNRRFHAEPVACPECGPQLSYRRPGDAAPAAHREAALAAALADLRAGRIVAVKGLGGYHLACDATDPAAVARLRDRKHRWAKPFAVMVRDVEAARAQAVLSPEEEALLISPARPIVLVERRRNAPRDVERPRNVEPPLADGVVSAEPERAAALNRRIGLFLPYAPLHHLLLEGLGRPIVLTSGNLSDEPLATDDAEALERLAGIVDSFLSHNREIRARYDDSVTRVVDGRESLIRRGRGYAPEPLDLPIATPLPVLAVGAELKHTFALARGGRAHVAPHTGDLEDLLTHRAFETNLAHLKRLLDVEPEYVAYDLHPGYLSTQYAMRQFPESRRIPVQHHHAHVASAAAEAGLTTKFIGVAFDGLGMGDDGTFWGGEVLVATLADYRRVGRFGRAPMPGGALAVKKPYRMALGYLMAAETFEQADARSSARSDAGPDARSGSSSSWLDPELARAFLDRLDPREVEVVRVQLARGLNAPLASSAGRLFDAAASLLGIRDVAEYEAQAAVELELLAEEASARPLPYGIVREDDLLVYDPRPTIRALLEGRASGVTAETLAARFQETIAAVTRDLCVDVRASTGLRSVVLSGGVFQNQWLATTLVRRLSGDGFEVYTNRQIPANDGGISYGQAAVAAARLAGAA
ncbi:MAG: carbamoyltransferase HypF [Candidatus Limnocylindrales bacterium]